VIVVNPISQTQSLGSLDPEKRVVLAEPHRFAVVVFVSQYVPMGQMVQFAFPPKYPARHTQLESNTVPFDNVTLFAGHGVNDSEPNGQYASCGQSAHPVERCPYVPLRHLQSVKDEALLLAVASDETVALHHTGAKEPSIQ
jgi:hypothetical protein